MVHFRVLPRQSLKELDLSRCLNITDTGVMHLLSIPTLEKLSISETGVSSKGIMLISSLRNLITLDLGGLPVTDLALSSLKDLNKLEYLDLWGSKISDNGAAVLVMFPKLKFLNIARTKVTRLPYLPSLACLNMSNCVINSISGWHENKASLTKLILSGASIANLYEAFLYVDTSSLTFLDLSRSSLGSFDFLDSMNQLQHLDLSFSNVDDRSIIVIPLMGNNLRNLNLSNARISSNAIDTIASHVPNLETISLSNTLIDDVAICFIGWMSALKVINVSNTKVQGVSLRVLESLEFLERLDLEDTQVDDLNILYVPQGLRYLFLKSAFLTDTSLYTISSFMPKLIHLSIRDAALTNHGLYSFLPPASLKVLDLRGCQLLTKESILFFCRNHPQIELRHGPVLVPTIEPDDSHHSMLSRMTSKSSNYEQMSGQDFAYPNHLSSSSCLTSESPHLKQKHEKQKRGKEPISADRLNDLTFPDPRIKYSREVLLALQHSSSTLVSLLEGALSLFRTADPNHPSSSSSSSSCVTSESPHLKQKHGKQKRRKRKCGKQPF